MLGDAPVPADIEQRRPPRATPAAAGNEAMRLRPVVADSLVRADAKMSSSGDVADPEGHAPSSCSLAFRRVTQRASTALSRSLPSDGSRPGPCGKAHDASVHVPFGSGPRICPGRTLAILEMRVALATVYRSFDVERVGATADVSEVLTFTMAPRGLSVRLRRRAS